MHRSSGNLPKVLSVLDVGDGACSVLRHGERVAIIDCGSNDLGADVACDRLLAALGGRPDVITTIVVTHFDTDHYAGFMRLADRMATRGIRFTELHLVAPRPPEEPKYVAQYLALAMTVTGIRNLDLATALKNVTDEDRFFYLPVSRDLYPEFLAAGLRFTVRWPPVELPRRVANEVDTAMRLYGALARNLRAIENYALDNNLKRARYGDWPLLHPYDAEEASEEAESQRQRANAVDLDFEEDEAISAFPEIEALDLPEELKEQFKVAWDAFRRANNNMSIVFDDREHRNLAAFGDAGKSVLRWLAGHGGLASRYHVMLAPHHGTQCLPENFAVRAKLCVSQNGSRRGDLWPRHVETHHNSSSCTTTRFGSHHIYLWDD